MRVGEGQWVKVTEEPTSVSCMSCALLKGILHQVTLKEYSRSIKSVIHFDQQESPASWWIYTKDTLPNQTCVYVCLYCMILVSQSAEDL